VLFLSKLRSFSLFFGNVRSVVLGLFSPVIRYSPDEGSGAAATTGFIKPGVLLVRETWPACLSSSFVTMKKENGNFIAFMLPIALQMRISLILVFNEEYL